MTRLEKTVREFAKQTALSYGGKLLEDDSVVDLDGVKIATYTGFRLGIGGTLDLTWKLEKPMPYVSVGPVNV